MGIISAISITILITTLAWTTYHVAILILSALKKRHCEAVSSGIGNDLESFPKVSIIIPAKDEEAVIARCVESMLKQEYPKNKMEILIVEGGSKDDTSVICKGYCETHPEMINLISERVSNGKPSALNEGLKHATGEIVAIFDADNVLEKNVVGRAVSYFQEDSTVALQGKTSSINEDENYLTKIVAKTEKAWFEALIQSRHHLRLFVPLTGTCQFFRKDALLEHEGWREDSLAEDMDLALKLAQEGHQIQYANDIRCWQESPCHLKSLITQRTRWYTGYMENLILYGCLLKKPSLRLIDAEMTLLGPYIMVLCGLSYLIWPIKLLSSTQDAYMSLIPYGFSVVLTALTLFLMGASLLSMDKPFKIRKILWIPFIYLYWTVETLIAIWAFVQLVLPKKKVWRKTKKNGVVTNRNAIKN
jgi:cellulose synthase/poly-beta-1,6-N-acetylglucosamine synthase-like glycosyltransferase